MPRHTWTVRVELCETYDAVFAHAYLENGPIHLSGRGRAPVAVLTQATHARAVAACRALADLSQVMLAAEQVPADAEVPDPTPPDLTPPAPAHVRVVPAPEPNHSIFAASPESSVLSSSTTRRPARRCTPRGPPSGLVLVRPAHLWRMASRSGTPYVVG
ncbi:MAG: hypothetical protein QOH37_2032 [Nocardioidaceae bacterium]|nr:hypothetical protein [Nocardioidaceae bacterium]